MLRKDASVWWSTFSDQRNMRKITCSLLRYFSASALRISILCFLLLATSGLAIAADQKSSPIACLLTNEEAAGLNGDFSTDVHAVINYKSTIARLLKEQKFQELDCLADGARSGKERFPGGDWKLHTLYGGLYSPIQYPVIHATGEEWNTHLQLLQQWVTARPKSVTARVALARSYLNYAYDARGVGSSDTVSDSGWKLFAARTAEGRRILDEAKALSTRCPEWYVGMLLVAQNQGWRASDARALFEEAFQLEPGYFYAARMLANYLLPKWTGEEGVTEKFTQEIADRTGGDQGDVLYFEVATAPHMICGCDDEPLLSMERIAKGFEASEKKYGVSMLNLNLIAFLAANNKETDSIVADKALARIGAQWDEETWQKKEDFDKTKQWAATWAPRMAQTRAMEVTAQANMQTPEGSRYKVSFEKTYRELVQECMRTDGGSDTPSEGKLKTFTQVGAKGTIEADAIYAMNSVTMCVRRKLGLAWRDKLPVFSPPPQASYWVALELDWADFVPVAAK